MSTVNADASCHNYAYYLSTLDINRESGFGLQPDVAEATSGNAQKRRNPDRVAPVRGRFPRVVAALQPWAPFLNRVAVGAAIRIIFNLLLS